MIGLVDQATAVRQLRAAQYVPDVLPVGDDFVPPGLVIRTDPTGGTELPHSGHVKLSISTGKCPDGPCPVEVPNVEGLSESAARSLLQDREFAVRFFRERSDQPADQVVASEPKPTTLRPPGFEVVLRVSSGPHSFALAASLLTNPQPSTPAPGTPPPPTSTPLPLALKCSRTPSADRPADGLTIDSPGSGGSVGADNEAYGKVNLKSGESLWLLICAPLVEAREGGDVGGFYIVGGGPVSVSGGTWNQNNGLNTEYPGYYFLYAVLVNAG